MDYRSIALLALAAPLAAFAQSKGAYQVSANVTFTEASGKNKTEYAATVKGLLPVESAGAGGSNAEADPSGPPWTARITAMNTEQEATAKGLDGKFMRVTCKLTAPIEIPMMAQGSLSLDARKKEYALFVALISTKEVPVDCVNSQSGPYKSKKGVTLSVGTYLPHIAHGSMPYVDAASIPGKKTLTDPKQGITLQQEWTIALKK